MAGLAALHLAAAGPALAASEPFLNSTGALQECRVDEPQLM